jgi:hypothetical protein
MQDSQLGLIALGRAPDACPTLGVWTPLITASSTNCERTRAQATATSATSSGCQHLRSNDESIAWSLME